MRPAVLIANPVAGSGRRGRRLARLLERLRESGWAAELRTTRGPGEGTRLAREAVAAGRGGPVFAHGGDGTIREVARGLLGSGTPLGILPGGTTNVLARALGLPLVAERVPAALAGGGSAAIDVGSADGEPFLMAVSGGVDGAVMASQSAGWKRRLGRSAFVGAGLWSWWRYAYPEAEVRCDDGESLPATLVAVCNIPLYAGAFALAPEAQLHDGRLDLVVHRGRRAATAGLFRDLALGGRHVGRPDVVRRRVREVVIRVPEGFRFQIDGDPLPVAGETLRITLAAERLRVLLPPGSTRRAGVVDAG